MHISIMSLTGTYENMESLGDARKIIRNGRIGIVSMMKDPKNVEEWLHHHRNMGVIQFYIRLEETPALESLLKSQPDVVLTVGESSGVNEYEEIQVRQRNMVDAALADAMKTGDISWLIHIDSDELLAGDLDEIRNLPESVRTFWMENVEAVYDGVPGKTDSCFKAETFRECNKSDCKSYANGKGGGRVAEDVQSHGPHRFHSQTRETEGVKLQGVVVKHYESCDYDQYKKKYERLAVTNTALDIPFSYYKDSIEAAKTGDEDMLRCVYKKHRTVEGLNKDYNCSK